MFCNLNLKFSYLLDVKKLMFRKLVWPFSVWINYSSDLGRRYHLTRVNRWSDCVGYRIEIVYIYSTLSTILQHFTHNEIQWPTAARRWHFARTAGCIPQAKLPSMWKRDFAEYKNTVTELWIIELVSSNIRAHNNILSTGEMITPA